MKSSSVLVALLGIAVLSASAGAGENHAIVTADLDRRSSDRPDSPCPDGQLLLHYDGSAEDGHCWDYGGCVPPYYGAWAECYSYRGCVCGTRLVLSGIGYPCIPCDLYIWADAGGSPGSVLTVVYGANPCPVGIWPDTTTRDFALPDTPVDGDFWIGFWPNFANQPCGYVILADLDGPRGCPFTNVAPGNTYPTGWNSVSDIWGPTQSLGIGAWVHPCGGTPTIGSTWGRIKSLYTEER